MMSACRTSIRSTMPLLSTARSFAVCSLALLTSAASTRPNRRLCQQPDNRSLHGCPKNTVVVDPNGKLASIQQAILSIPANDEPYTVLIHPGTYNEQLNITRQGPLTLLGVTSSPNDRTKNEVDVVWHNATGTPQTGSYDNAYTSVLTVAPTLEASFTGSGPTGYPVPADTPFGNVDFRVYNLNFINDYLPYSAGPSLALSLSYANGGFYYTRFLSYQDTVRSRIFPSIRLPLTILCVRSTSVSWATHTCMNPKSPGRQTSSTASAHAGSPTLSSLCVVAAAESLLGRVRTRLSRINTEFTFTIAACEKRIPAWILRASALLDGRGMHNIAQFLPIPILIVVSGPVDTSSGEVLIRGSIQVRTCPRGKPCSDFADLYVTCRYHHGGVQDLWSWLQRYWQSGSGWHYKGAD